MIDYVSYAVVGGVWALFMWFILNHQCDPEKGCGKFFLYGDGTLSCVENGHISKPRKKK